MTVSGAAYRERFFREPLAEDLKAIIETERARPLHAEYHRFDKAHVVMLTERGLIPRSEGIEILRALASMDADPVGSREASGGGAHAGERYITSVVGDDVGGHIHLGRSTGDLTATAVRMRLRRRMLDVMHASLEARRACLDGAARYSGTVMAAYTFGQQTQPVTLGHLLVAYASALGRDFERLTELYRRADRSPAGGVILAGTSISIDRERVASLLGFRTVDTNTYDAVLAQDVLLEALWVLAMTSADVARVAEDLMFFASTEIAIVQIPDRFSGTSSVAAHKRNPYATQVMKGAGASAIGALVSGFITEKGPTGMAVQDRAFTLRALWGTYDDVERDLRWLAEIIDGLAVDEDRALELVEEHWATSTDLAAMLVESAGLPWRTAHQVLGVLVRNVRSRGGGPMDLTPIDVADATEAVAGQRIDVTEEQLINSLSAQGFVNRRAHEGGPAPDEVARQIAVLRGQLENDRGVVTSSMERLAAADRRLDEAVAALIDPNRTVEPASTPAGGSPA